MTSHGPSHQRNLEDFAGIASDWFWETDATHRFIYFSDLMQESTGVDPKKFLGLCRLDFMHDDLMSDKWRSHIDELAQRKPFRSLEYHVLRDDGSVLWLRVSGVPVFAEDGSFQGYRGTGHNITEERLTIARFEAANAALQLRNRQLDKTRRALERAVHEDTLTEVWNRRAFERDIETAIECANRNVGLLQIDLDQFKWVNDTLGHQAGDTVLKAAASRISATVGFLGTTYRVGGDEFIVLLGDHVTEDMAINLGHQITNAMSVPIELGHRPVTIGVSVGVAVNSRINMSAARLIQQADAALYEAKERGRNAVCAMNDGLRNKVLKYTATAADLPSAIKAGEFVPYFQPQMDLATREIIGVEALVRWHHPDRGIIHPQDFLQIASEMALNDEIDRQMMRKGLAAIDRLADQGIIIPSLSINTSQARLLDPRLISDVGCLWTNKACGLSLELLETISFDECCDNIQLSHNLDRLRAMGVRIETDDFGSARASITALLKVSPHRLKIDKSLVQEVVANPSKRNILCAILDLAQTLNIACMAEGAEDQNALDVLKSLGCTQVQGYAVGHPMPEAELADFMRAAQPQAKATPKTAQKETADPVDLPRTA